MTRGIKSETISNITQLGCAEKDLWKTESDYAESIKWTKSEIRSWSLGADMMFILFRFIVAICLVFSVFFYSQSKIPVFSLSIVAITLQFLFHPLFETFEKTSKKRLDAYKEKRAKAQDCLKQCRDIIAKVADGTLEIDDEQIEKLIKLWSNLQCESEKLKYETVLYVNEDKCELEEGCKCSGCDPKCSPVA